MRCAGAGVALDGAGGSLGRDAPLGGTEGTGATGAGGAAFGFSAATLASVSIRATTVCTATVWPSCTMISARVPATGAGISASTLSVEISKMGSSRLIGSPTFFIQRESVPSAIDSPIWGIMTSILAIRISDSAGLRGSGAAGQPKHTNGELYPS